MSRSAVWVIIVLAVALVLSLRYSGGWFPGTGPERTVEVVQLVTEPGCTPLGRPCRALGTGMTVAFELAAEARPMRAFPVRVAVGGDADRSADAVSVEFLMEGMDMGLNRFRLQRREPGQWGAQVTLPICTTGRSDWLAVVDVDTADRRYRARFPFELP